MPRVARFEPFAETELRLRVTIELLRPEETFDVFVMHADEPHGADSEQEAIRRARQLLAVASHSLAG
jgi:hypothetical protein